MEDYTTLNRAFGIDAPLFLPEEKNIELISGGMSDNMKEQISMSLKRYYAENEISEETREKLRQNWLGRKHTEASKAKMRKPKKPFTKEHRENLSKAFTGREYSEEYKENMRRLKNDTPYRITYDDGRVEIINGLSAFARENNYGYVNLHSVKRGDSKYHKDIVSVEKLSKTP